MSYKTIFQAIKANNFLAVKEFTELRNINKNAVNKAGYNIIEIAFYNTGRDEEIINYLIDNDYPINFNSKKLQGIVFNIIKRDSSELLKKLISKKLPLDYTSIQGYSLYEYAFFYKSTKCIQLLGDFFNVKKDPFIMIEKGEFLPLIHFLKENKNYDLYFKKGYKNLLLQSLVSRNLKCFIYLLKKYYQDAKLLNSFLHKELRNFLICTQFKNEIFLKAFLKYKSYALDTSIKIELLKYSVANQHLKNIDSIYDILNNDDKKHNNGEIYSHFYEYYKTNNDQVIEILYNKALRDQKDVSISKMAKKAEHPAIFYLRKLNKKKYDYYLNKYPNYNSEEFSIFLKLSFQNCNMDLVDHFLENKSDKDNYFSSDLLNAYLLSKKSINIKFKFYKDLKEKGFIESLFFSPYHADEFLLNFYNALIYTRQYKLFNMIFDSENLSSNNFTIEQHTSFMSNDKTNLKSIYSLFLFIELNSNKNYFYDPYNNKSIEINFTSDDYITSLINIININYINIDNIVTEDFIKFIYSFYNHGKPNLSSPKKASYIDISKTKIIDILERHSLLDPNLIGMRSKLEKNKINNTVFINQGKIENLTKLKRKRL